MKPTTAWLENNSIRIGPLSFAPSDLVFVALVVVVSILATRLLRAAIERAAARGPAANRPAYYTIGRVGNYVIVTLAAVVGIQLLGIDVSSLTVMAGAIGLGVGLGLQQAVNNFVSGLMLLFERSLKVDDFIELENGLQGRVNAINVRSTVLTTNDNLDVVVPNSMFTNGVLTNWTMSNERRRIHVPFGVAYGSDKEAVKQAALEAASRVDAGDAEPEQPAQVWLVGFGESSLDFELVVWVGRDSLCRPAHTRARFLWELETSLRAHGIEIPFPQRDLHLRSGFAAPAGAEAGSGRPRSST